MVGCEKGAILETVVKLYKNRVITDVSVDLPMASSVEGLYFEGKMDRPLKSGRDYSTAKRLTLHANFLISLPSLTDDPTGEVAALICKFTDGKHCKIIILQIDKEKDTKPEEKPKATLKKNRTIGLALGVLLISAIIAKKIKNRRHE